MHGLFEGNIAAGPLIVWFVVLCCKHVLADFLWQPQWMALGKEQPSGWLRPLLAHCLIHGACTTALLLLLEPRLWPLGLVDFVVHLTIDRTKGYIISRNGLTPADRPFWPLLGIDQTLHHLTGFMIAVVIAERVT